MEKTDMAVVITGIISLLTLLMYVSYTNNIGATKAELEPSKRGYVQVVKELKCTPKYEKVWVKPESKGEAK